MEARPIPKPAIPCSVRGVLNTRSRPVSVELGWWGLGGVTYRTLRRGPGERERVSGQTINKGGVPTMVHLKTPPKATSSPKTTALSSLANAMLDGVDERAGVGESELT